MLVCTGIWINNLKKTGIRAGAPHKALAEIIYPHTSISYFESKVGVYLISEVPLLWTVTAASQSSNICIKFNLNLSLSSLVAF